jgi:hypothetical protein
MCRIISNPVITGIQKSLRTRPMSAWCSEKRFQSLSSTSGFKYLVTGILNSRNYKPQYPESSSTTKMVSGCTDPSSSEWQFSYHDLRSWDETRSEAVTRCPEHT